MVQATSCGQLFSIRRQEHFFCCFGENISQLVSNQEAIFHSWPGQQKSLDIRKLVIAQRELAWQWDLFDFRILQDCKVCCAVLNHRLVGCIVQHILREELTKLLPSKTPPCNARNPRSSSFYFNQHLLYMSMSGFQRALGGILISSTLPYSEEFHFKLESVHSWWQTNFPHKMLDKTLPDILPTCLNEILSFLIQNL